jgi:hypothetical protein
MRPPKGGDRINRIEKMDEQDSRNGVVIGAIRVDGFEVHPSRHGL